MKTAWNKFRTNLDATREDEAGDIVQTILIIAVFVVIVVVVGKLLYDSIVERAGDTSDCITGVNAQSAGGINNGAC